jgi:hypothetical protein
VRAVGSIWLLSCRGLLRLRERHVNRTADPRCVEVEPNLAIQLVGKVTLNEPRAQAAPDPLSGPINVPCVPAVAAVPAGHRSR